MEKEIAILITKNEKEEETINVSLRPQDVNGLYVGDLCVAEMKGGMLVFALKPTGAVIAEEADESVVMQVSSAEDHMLFHLMAAICVSSKQELIHLSALIVPRFMPILWKKWPRFKGANLIPCAGEGNYYVRTVTGSILYIEFDKHEGKIRRIDPLGLNALDVEHAPMQAEGKRIDDIAYEIDLWAWSTLQSYTGTNDTGNLYKKIENGIAEAVLAL